jgi:hypothetical protein
LCKLLSEKGDDIEAFYKNVSGDANIIQCLIDEVAKNSSKREFSFWETCTDQSCIPIRPFLATGPYPFLEGIKLCLV